MPHQPKPDGRLRAPHHGPALDEQRSKQEELDGQYGYRVKAPCTQVQQRFQADRH